MTLKLLTLLTQHVHEKICGLQCRICEYASESPSDVHVKAVHLNIRNLKCEEVWRSLDILFSVPNLWTNILCFAILPLWAAAYPHCWTSFSPCKATWACWTGFSSCIALWTLLTFTLNYQPLLFGKMPPEPGIWVTLFTHKHGWISDVVSAEFRAERDIINVRSLDVSSLFICDKCKSF